MPKKHAGGRPREGEEIKRAPLNLRTSPDLRQMIEEAADANGLSLTQEVEHRLRSTFWEEQWMGNSSIRSFVKMLGSTIDKIETTTGKRWTRDAKTWAAVEESARHLLAWDRPLPPRAQETFDAQHAWFEAAQEHDRAVRALDDFRIAHGLASIRGFASEVVRPAGLFASAPRSARDGWTDEQREEEAQLMRAAQEAAEAEVQARAHAGAMAAPLEAAVADGRTLGNELATEWFRLLGPKKLKPES